MRQRALDIHPSTRRRPVRTALSATAAAALAAGLALTGAGAAQAAPVTIDIVDINDFHGRITQSRTAPAAGAASLAGYLDSVRAQNANTLFVSAGDNIGASTFESAVQKDTPTLQILDQMGLVASSAGNHEFDLGADDLVGRVDREATFPYLAANVFRNGAPLLQEYFVKEVAGVRVGFIGAVTEDLPSLVASSGLAGVEVRDIVSNVNRVADALQDGDTANGEADVVIALVHEGPASGSLADSTNDSAFGEIVTGLNNNVDVIFGAHTHQVVDHVIGGRPVMSAGQYGENAARLSFTYDPDTDSLTFPVTDVVPLSVDTDPSPTVSNWAPIYPANQAVADSVARAVTVANERGAVPVGKITQSFNRARQADGTSENRGGESTIGNFIADVHLAATRELGTQVAFMNPGGIRDNLGFASSGTAGDADGVVTYREAATVQPFANTLVTLDLTGAQIKEVLENQWQPSGARNAFLKLGLSADLTYIYDPQAPAGSHVTQVFFKGEPLGSDTVLKVVANSFLAAGGDNFTGFRAGTSRADSGRVDLQATVDYFASQTAAVAPPLNQRAVGVRVPDAPADGYEPGDTITMGLSSLLFSTNEPKATTVEARIGSQLVGSAPIDPTVVNGTDETGRATLTITIPESAAPGDYDVDVTTVGATGGNTGFSLPITVAGELPGEGGGTDPGAGSGSGSGSGSGEGASAGGSAPAGSATGANGGLASTGFDSATLVGPSIAGALLMLLGAGIIVARRARAKAVTKA